MVALGLIVVVPSRFGLNSVSSWPFYVPLGRFNVGVFFSVDYYGCFVLILVRSGQCMVILDRFMVASDLFGFVHNSFWLDWVN